MKTKFSFMPEGQQREVEKPKEGKNLNLVQVREATLSVLDIFGQPVEEDEPMLVPLGYDSSAPASPQLSSGSSEERGGRSEIPGGTLVHQYLKQNSQVNTNYHTFWGSFDH